MAQQQSILAMLLSTLGPYAWLIGGMGGVCFLLMIVIVVRGRGPGSFAAIVLLANAPFLIGLFAGLQRAMMSFITIAQSSVTPKPSELASGYMAMLVGPLIGLAFTAPAYLVGAFGGLYKAMTSDDADHR